MLKMDIEMRDDSKHKSYFSLKFYIKNKMASL